MAFDPETKLKYKPMGTSNSILSGRISWFFDFKGPSLTVDTACSSSMVAFHLGCQNLRNHESDMSIICGVNIFVWPTDWFGMAHHGFLSPDGKCYSFDHRASGYSRGEGVGTLVVKRLSTALRDGDTIRAVVRGTALNQDGRTPGVTVPSTAAQERLIQETYAKAGIDVRETALNRICMLLYVGTAAGDPIEARAIATAFQSNARKYPLILGAVKSAIGHTERASGIASIIKSVMILKEGLIPTNANFEKPNPKIPFGKYKLQLATKPIPWPLPGPRRASINSFGFSDLPAPLARQLQSAIRNPPTNGAPEEPAPIQPMDKDRENNKISEANRLDETARNVEKSANGVIKVQTVRNSRIFVFSSFDEVGLKRNFENLAEHLNYLGSTQAKTEDLYLNDLAYTLSNKRTIFPWRSYCLASSINELAASLLKGTGISKPVRVRSAPIIGFIFTGQGAQWWGMGRELLGFVSFSQSLQDATAYMKSLGSPWLLLDELLQDKDNSKINGPSLAHPACTALQVALVELLFSWGLVPSVVAGHSSGEIAAAFCSGKITHEEVWKIAHFRGKVSEKVMYKGAMLAVGLTITDLSPYMNRINAKHSGELTVACLNSPKNHTISGDEAKVDALKKLLDLDSVFTRKLNVVTAYHSKHMRIVADEYLALLQSVQSNENSPTKREIQMISTVTGKLVEGELG
ncbi:thiolase-like protein [Glonium stellatum]|uniref:Thiolase-like protein n=1 Tax=Glonium stellatum TaxID=574774 RepID=A0A8E2F3E5_9PEZI|nr:thiolase-like protein [Glonium stellatum]